jgi:hypothetical protein
MALAPAVLTCTNSVDAAPLIEESFVYDAGSVAGENGGTGFTGAWSTRNAAPAVNATGLSYGSLNVAGGSIQGAGGGSGYRDIGASSVLDTNNLMNDGASLWFSFVITKPATQNANVDINLSLGTDGFHQFVTGGGGTFGQRKELETGEGIGVSLVNAGASDLRVAGSVWQNNDADDNAEQTTQNSSSLLSGEGTHLIVGRIDWHDGTTIINDRLTLYVPGTDLSLGTAVLDNWDTGVNLDQSAFDTVAFEIKFSGAYLDEIRFGATSGDVLPVPEPTSLALLGLGGLLIARRRRA